MNETLSYAASLLAMIIGFIEPFNKKMTVVLIFSFVANLLVGISYILVGGVSGALICVVAGIQLLVNFTFTVRNKKIPVWLILVYSAAYCVVNISTFVNWYDIFSLCAALGFVFSMAQSNPKYYRLLLITNMGSWLIYDIFAHAYGNMIMHISSVITIVVAIYVRDMRCKNKQVNEERI
ncbi:MAG: YgjV family protein [Ruminococcaceae bacterium]|nr:YgjV family protein [Oscillospiraceae bacterium]